MKRSYLVLLLVIIYSLCDCNLFAQIKLITTIPGVPAQRYETEPVDYKQGGDNIMDLSGDGVSDITLFKESDDLPTEEIVFLKITDGTDLNNRWEIPLPNGIIAVLIGFYNLTEGSYKPGEGISFKEIIVAEKKGNKYINPVIISSDDNYETVEYESFGAHSVLVAAGDINGDGQAEIAVFDPDAKEVQVWGYK